MDEKDTAARDQLFSRLTTMRAAIDEVLAHPESIETIVENLAKVSAIVRGKENQPDLHSEAEADAYIDAVKKAAPPGFQTSTRTIDGPFMARMILKAVNILQREPEMENDPTMVWIVLNQAAKSMADYLGIMDAGSALIHKKNETTFNVPMGKGGNA